MGVITQIQHKRAKKYRGITELKTQKGHDTGYRSLRLNSQLTYQYGKAIAKKAVRIEAENEGASDPNPHPHPLLLFCSLFFCSSLPLLFRFRFGRRFCFILFVFGGY